MPLTLTWKGSIGRPVSGEALRPDLLSRSLDEVARVSLPAGNGTVELGELFRIEGDGGDHHLILEGDLREIGGLASGMAAGKLEVRGDVGPRMGVGMVGGSILVEGSAGHWAGAEMRGGSIRIREDAGDFLGAALPGSRLGMREGVIVVDGDVGDDAGLLLRRGLIAVGGSLGENAGRRMIAGTLFGFGSVGPGLGYGMKRGTIGLFGIAKGIDLDVSPTFEPSGSFRPHYLSIFLNYLQGSGLRVPSSAFRGAIRRYNGDRLESGRGEILVVESSVE